MSVFTGKRVVVTGGAGFIGSNLCEHLLNAQNEVTCIDNISTGKKSNVEALMSNGNFSFREEDITTSKKLEDLFKGAHVVFHQAALGSVPRSVHNPLASHEVNATGFLHVLEACKAAGVKRVVYASSSSVYGDSAVLPKSEGQLGNPLSPYAVSKLTNELYASVFSRLYGMECVGLRYFNVFGPKQDPNGEYAAAIPRFILSIRKKQSPVIFGDGEQTRDFTYIENVIQANIKAALAPAHTAGKVYNIAYGKSVTVNQMFTTIRALLAVNDPSLSSVHASYADERPGDVKFSLADISAAQRDLGYAPEFDFESGMAKAIEWYWRHLS